MIVTYKHSITSSLRWDTQRVRCYVYERRKNMSIAFKTCPHCDDGEAEALYAVDYKIQWYCNECSQSWLEEPKAYEVVTAQQQWMLENYGEEC